MNELAGQVALVTGGSRGIGLAIAQELGRASARVAIVARNGEAAEAAATESWATLQTGARESYQTLRSSIEQASARLKQG